MSETENNNNNTTVENPVSTEENASTEGGGGEETLVETPDLQVNVDDYYERALAVAEKLSFSEESNEGDNQEDIQEKPEGSEEETTVEESPPTNEPSVEEKKKETDRWEKLLNKEKQLLTHKDDLTKFDHIKQQIAEGNFEEALGSLGITYEQLTTYYLTDPGNNTDLLSEKFDAFKSEQEQKIQTLQQQLAEKDYNEKKSVWLKKISTETSADSGDRWEVLKSLDNYQEEVLAYQEGVYAKTKKIVSITEASDILEKELISQSTSLKLTPKIIKKLGLPSNTPTERHRTNFNSVNNSSTSAVSQKERTDFSPEACRARAIAVIPD